MASVTEEIDLDELERRLREKWQPQAFTPAVDAEAMSVARQIMDKGNARRLAATRRGDRFRYRPVVTTAEYYVVPPHPTLPLSGVSGWRIDVFEDGKKRTSTPGLSEESCLRIANMMTRKGIRVRRVETELMRRHASVPAAPNTRPAPSRRLAMLNQLARVKV